VRVAKAAGADAVHPGYGFLAENAAFAEACAAAGLVFIGPPPQAIRALATRPRRGGSRASSGVPTVPGTFDPVAGEAAVRAAAREIGYPLMIKASMGGGGKGMREVHAESELMAALGLAQSEASYSFGDGAVYLERLLLEPRHIEVQVLADTHGHVVHLGERECSIQRRHQKLVEESPSPFVDPAMRARLGDAACRIAKAAGYVNAGTVEFLVDADRNFYFLEMNTRLQVEHPVTEMVTGIDLVREQLRIAGGEPLGFVQGDVSLRGAAIECRINAEDPFGGWMPSPGTIIGLRAATGPWVRDDSGAYEGYTVPRFYDTLLAKLIVWGADRPAAIRGWRARSPSTRWSGSSRRSRCWPRSWATTISAPGGSRRASSTGCCDVRGREEPRPVGRGDRGGARRVRAPGPAHDRRGSAAVAGTTGEPAVIPGGGREVSR